MKTGAESIGKSANVEAGEFSQVTDICMQDVCIMTIMLYQLYQISCHMFFKVTCDSVCILIILLISCHDLKKKQNQTCLFSLLGIFSNGLTGYSGG